MAPIVNDYNFPAIFFLLAVIFSLLVAVVFVVCLVMVIRYVRGKTQTDKKLLQSAEEIIALLHQR
ncbi:MAG: hypothetical protein LBT22_01420 [Peptococcaceae bacterium]|nr:hypothetical protein [Peptococcaceae bacterium]